MNAPALTREEGLGLALAALGHAALVWVLVTAKPPEALPPVERISVTLSEEVGAVSTSPDPTANPAPDTGPELGEPAPAPEPVRAPQPQFSAVPPPRPAPAAKAPPKPPQQAVKTPAKTPPAKGGASVLDPNFGKGITGGTGKDKTPAASKASAQVVASWDSFIKSKVLNRWNSCPVSGLDTNKLRASVRFTLSTTGGILSIEEPVITGVTDANSAQVRPFRDCAIRAIKLAAPFTGMPVEFYDQWKPRKLNFSK